MADPGGGSTSPPRQADRPRPSGHSAFGRVLYAFLWVLCRVLAVALLGFRVRFRGAVPMHGGLMLLSSHQSHLDPLLLGLASPRRLSSLARSSLFDQPAFGAVIRALDAVPIDREASAVGAMKAVISRLRGGGAVNIFPEGTRTADGRLGPLKSGFSVIARRAGVPILPVAIVGAYECWPRSRLLPRPGTVRLEFGEPISAERVRELNDADLVALCSDTLASLDAEARRLRDHALQRRRPAD